MAMFVVLFIPCVVFKWFQPALIDFRPQRDTNCKHNIDIFSPIQLLQWLIQLIFYVLTTHSNINAHLW